MELLVITGMSGAGKSQACHVLEDIGFYCVDNLPSKLVGSFVETCVQSDDPVDRLALVVDARSKGSFRDIFHQLKTFREENRLYKLLFVDADDDVLTRRYKETRRAHPLMNEQYPTLQAAIAREREILQGARELADYVLDTSKTSPAQLKEQVHNIFLTNIQEGMRVSCMSFGYKYGVPGEADLVFDVRCLPNPFYLPELRPLTGLDKPVRDYVMQWEQSKELEQKLMDLIDYLLPLYLEEGKSQLVIAMGCTGGKHRSVTFAERMSQHVREQGYKASTNHRDIVKK